MSIYTILPTLKPQRCKKLDKDYTFYVWSRGLRKILYIVIIFQVRFIDGDISSPMKVLSPLIIFSYKSTDLVSIADYSYRECFVVTDCKKFSKRFLFSLSLSFSSSLVTDNLFYDTQSENVFFIFFFTKIKRPDYIIG